MRFSKEEINSWGNGNKKCSLCMCIKPLSDFSKESKLLFGVSSTCRGCKTSGQFRPHRKWTKEEVSSWPTNHKACFACGKVKNFENFHKNKFQLFGLASDCKECRKLASKKTWEAERNKIAKQIINRSKSRAAKQGIIHTITEEDIDLPEKCPVFGVPFKIGDRDWTYSIDRINPNIGYTPDNIIIVSNRANIIKNNASPEEIFAVAMFYSRLL